MKKKFSLILIYLLSAAGGIAVAESFESLDAILSTVRDANQAKQERKMEEKRAEEAHRHRREQKKKHRDCERRQHKTSSRAAAGYRRP